MYQRSIRSIIFKNVRQSAITGVYPSNFFSSVPTHPHNKDPNLVDDIKEPVSGLDSSASMNDRVNVVNKSSTTSSYDRRDNSGDDIGSYVADTAKQGIVKALETGLEIGEVAKKTLDIMWDATKDTTHKLKDVVVGDGKEKNDVSRTDQSIDDMRRRTDYDLSKKYKKGN